MSRYCFGVFSLLAVVLFSGLVFGFEEPQWEEILNENLNGWEVWTGTPASGVKLPEGYSRGNDPKNIPPIGLGDPLGLFTMQRDRDGSLVLYVSGESKGALTTKTEYSNYHLSLQFKWAEQDGTLTRDSGLLYHSVGPYGAMWNNWKRSIELQMKEGAIGDLYLLGGFEVLATTDDKFIWDPSKEKSKRGGDKVTKIAASQHNESPLGEWTQIDIYVLGNSALHVINGKPVVAISDIELDGKAISSGAIQIQSGSSPCYFKDVRIRQITKLPNLKEFR